jgi:hypothetical protein
MELWYPCIHTSYKCYITIQRQASRLPPKPPSRQLCRNPLSFSCSTPLTTHYAFILNSSSTEERENFSKTSIGNVLVISYVLFSRVIHAKEEFRKENSLLEQLAYHCSGMIQPFCPLNHLSFLPISSNPYDQERRGGTYHKAEQRKLSQLHHPSMPITCFPQLGSLNHI